MNLTAVRDRAHQYILEQTGDVKDAKKLADSTRFLAMLRRNFAEEFKKLVAQKEEPKEEAKTKMLKKLFHQIEFFLEPSIESITRESKRGQDFRQNWRVERCIRFREDPEDHCLSSQGVYSPHGVGKRFCMEILNALIETADPPGDMGLRNDLIQLLEEKFDLKIKVCGNCKYVQPGTPYWCCSNVFRQIPDLFHLCYLNDSWTPKEVSEKPSSA